MEEKLEDIAMMIIANSGAARSSAFGALELTKLGECDAAQDMVKEAEKCLHDAHESHRELLKMDAKGEVDKVSILLAHAQDHLMNSTLATELIKEMIVLYKKIDN